jgi:hypothetical protein
MFKNDVENKVIAAGVFLFAFIIYFSTMAPTVSFWDCGEFIACSYRLAVPHPPGAPLFLIVGRIFTLLPLFKDIAARVNLISVISSAFTVFFLYLSIVHLIREFYKDKIGFHKYIPMISGVIGALSFAFSNSFWFNAVESEVYAPSMLFTGLVVWLILKWSEKSNQVGNEKYVLIIAYLMGLATGVHLLNVLAVPMVVLIIYFRRYRITWESFVVMTGIGVALTLLVYPGVVKGVPLIAEHMGFFGIIVSLIVLAVFFTMAVRSHHEVFSLLLMSVLLIVIGYSTYLMVYIRSGLNPNIDENNPDTIEAFINYLNREQYGEHTFDRVTEWQQSPNRDLYTSASDFFWNYQINKMYIRYFLWNFAGSDDKTGDVDWSKFFAIPLLLGLFGAWYHFNKDWKHALAVFVLFFMTGLAIIIYLNQPDPQPRERDYSYVGSFFAFAIWIGIGTVGILEWVSKIGEKQGQIIPIAMSAILFVISPIQMLLKNYDQQDRSGNYVASDYSYNMLISCEDNAVLYTNGDNDTFPLWYLQEVENVRPDLRVANLSLLNTDWYILQLKHFQPTVPISLTDEQIKLMTSPQGFEKVLSWPRKRRIELEFPNRIRKEESKEFATHFELGNYPDKISFDLSPKLAKRFLRVQDYMILNTLYSNNFRKPLYFAVTTSTSNQLDGLRNYLRMDGLVLKITTIPNWSIQPDLLYDNLVHKFRYRNLNNKHVYFNENIVGLLQNYRAAFSQLSNYYLTTNDTSKFRDVVRKIYEVMPSDVIPYTNDVIEQHLETYGYIAGIRPIEDLQKIDYPVNVLQGMGQLAMGFRNLKLARSAFEKLLSIDPDNTRSKGYLIRIYEEEHDYDSAINILEDWVSQNPQDSGAVRRLKEFKELRSEQTNE